MCDDAGIGLLIAPERHGFPLEFAGPFRGDEGEAVCVHGDVIPLRFQLVEPAAVGPLDFSGCVEFCDEHGLGIRTDQLQMIEIESAAEIAGDVNVARSVRVDAVGIGVASGIEHRLCPEQIPRWIVFGHKKVLIPGQCDRSEIDRIE